MRWLLLALCVLGHSNCDNSIFFVKIYPASKILKIASQPSDVSIKRRMDFPVVEFTTFR